MMSPELATDILEFIFATEKNLNRAAMDAVAQSRKVRPVFLDRQPRTARYATMAATLARPGLDAAADNLIRAWLLKKQNGMLVDFLNGLQIPHENGVVEDLPQAVEGALLQQAVDNLLAKYPTEAVTLYLHAFNQMNNAQWANLEEMLYTQPSLKLGK